MVEELFMAVGMSVVFTLPVWYLCQLQGSFFVFWLAWLISLADGIGVSLLGMHDLLLVCTPGAPQLAHSSLKISNIWFSVLLLVAKCQKARQCVEST